MNFAPISTAQVSGHNPQPVTAIPITVDDAIPYDVVDAAPIEVSVSNPTLERIYAAEDVYDPRGVHLDNTPRGVEIDRVEMIRQGFEHLHDLIKKISETSAQSDDTDQMSLDIKL